MKQKQINKQYKKLKKQLSPKNKKVLDDTLKDLVIYKKKYEDASNVMVKEKYRREIETCYRIIEDLKIIDQDEAWHRFFYWIGEASAEVLKGAIKDIA